MVSIPACHAGDPGSIPGNGDPFLLRVDIFGYYCYAVILNQSQTIVTTHEAFYESCTAANRLKPFFMTPPQE